MNRNKEKKKGNLELISQNLLYSGRKIMKISLEQYEDFSKGYDTLSGARFHKAIAEEISELKKDPSIIEVKIIKSEKFGKLNSPNLLTPRCKECKRHLKRVGEEITREKNEKEYKNLFYFCDCGYLGKIKMGFDL